MPLVRHRRFFMNAIHPIAATLALCGALAASAAIAQSTPAATPATPPQPATPQQSAPQTMPRSTPPPITTPSPNPALPPSAGSSGTPPGNRTLQQQQQNLRNGVERRSDDSIHRNGHRPADASGNPAPASSSY
jgi:hypothetical protein